MHDTTIDKVALLVQEEKEREKERKIKRKDKIWEKKKEERTRETVQTSKHLAYSQSWFLSNTTHALGRTEDIPKVDLE